MKLWEALKIHEETGRKIRPSINNAKKIFNEDRYCMPEKWFEFAAGATCSPSLNTIHDFFKISWEVEPAKVEVTRKQLKDAFNVSIGCYIFPEDVFEKFCKELGL